MFALEKKSDITPESINLLENRSAPVVTEVVTSVVVTEVLTSAIVTEVVTSVVVTEVLTSAIVTEVVTSAVVTEAVTLVTDDTLNVTRSLYNSRQLTIV